MSFCIPKIAADQLKAAFKSGEIKISDLYNAKSSEERRNMFKKYASDELAQQISSSLEKAMVSKQKDALKKWAKRTLTPKQERAGVHKTIIEKIDSLGKLGVLNRANATSYIDDLVSDAEGVGINPEELKKISALTKDLEALFNQNQADPPVAYWVKRAELYKYLYSLSPSKQIAILFSTIGRATMLASIKSPVVNIESNIVQGALQALERRISTATVTGANNDYAVEYMKKVWEIYQKSGYDITRMQSLTDERKILGEEIVHSEGKGYLRAYGRFVEDIVFKQLMGAPDVAASAIAFADSANNNSTKLAKGDKAKALAIFKEATQIKNKYSPEAEIVRNQAISDAMYATWTNRGGFSDLSLGIRALLNKFSGGVRLGDQIMRFVKTPANVIQANVESAGGAIIIAGVKLPEALRQLKDGNKQPMMDLARMATRAGIGFTFALMLAFQFDPDDFVGDWELLSDKQRALNKLKNAPYNAVRIGGKWISLDYLGPLGAAFVGIMYARKYGPVHYARGFGSQILRVPGLREVSNLIETMKKTFQQNDMKKSTETITNDLLNYMRANIVPAFVSDIARGIDPFERKTDKGVLSKLQASVPGWRQGLPQQRSTVTGEAIKGEGIASTILFGGRVKTAQNSKLIDEISRLEKSGEGPTIADITVSSSRMRELSNRLDPEEMQEALGFYGKIYSRFATKIIDLKGYKRINDEEKKKILNELRKDALDATVAKYGRGQ